jgi:hypothetical protein
MTFSVSAIMLGNSDPNRWKEDYEDPLQEVLQAQKLGDVVRIVSGEAREDPFQKTLTDIGLAGITGSGSLVSTEEPFFVIDFELKNLDTALQLAKTKLQSLGAEEGSVLQYEMDDEVVTLPINDQ